MAIIGWLVGAENAINWLIILGGKIWLNCFLPLFLEAFSASQFFTSQPPIDSSGLFMRQVPWLPKHTTAKTSSSQAGQEEEGAGDREPQHQLLHWRVRTLELMMMTPLFRSVDTAVYGAVSVRCLVLRARLRSRSDLLRLNPLHRKESSSQHGLHAAYMYQCTHLL